MPYTDKHGTFFGRVGTDGLIDVLHISDGSAATRLDAVCRSSLPARE
jgi:hypothetical protein